MSQRVFYQIFCGRWAPANVVDHPGQVLARLRDMDWQRLRASGCTDIYWLGVWDTRGEIVVQEEEGVDLSQWPRVPSPFAITDHTKPHPDLGTAKELRALVAAARTAGFKNWVDFVPNHTGKNHPWTKANPDYYIRTADSMVEEFSGDVVKLNYGNPTLVQEMIGVIESIAEYGFDGVRCDMAHLVPTDFWQRAISEVRKAYPEFGFLAEAYSQSVYAWEILEQLLAAGFDLMYHEFFYRNLRSVTEDHQPARFVTDHLNYFINRPDANRYLTYLANHDDPLPGRGTDFLPAWIALIAVLPGPLLIYNGTLNGYSRRLAHHAVEILNENYLETIQLPGWWNDLNAYLSRYRPEVTSLGWRGGILELGLKAGRDEHRVILQWMEEEAELPADARLGKALVSFQQEEGCLRPGEFVFYMTRG